MHAICLVQAGPLQMSRRSGLFQTFALYAKCASALTQVRSTSILLAEYLET